MSTVTTNLQLEKPDNPDYVDVAVLNRNYDKLDTFSVNVDYSDNIINKPTINSVEIDGDLSASDLGFATVATTGEYSDLSNTPSIPSKTSDLTNDSNFVSDASYVHTDANYTTSEKTKLASVESNANNYVLPTATTTTLGGVKVDGTTIEINNGVISSVGGGGGGGASYFSQLNDVEVTTPTNNNIPVYDTTNSKWKNKTLSDIGGRPVFKGTTAEVLAHYNISSLSQLPAGSQTVVTDMGGNGAWYGDQAAYDALPVSKLSDGVMHFIFDGTSDYLYANLVSYDNTTSGLTSTNVQSAIDELAAGGGGGTAETTTYDNTDSGLNAENVQDAIDEIAPWVGTEAEALSEFSISDLSQLPEGRRYIITDKSNLMSAGNVSLSSITGMTSTNVQDGVSELKTMIDGKANSSHNHAISDVTNLSSTLGNTNISTIGDGTVTGAIYQVNSNLTQLIKQADYTISATTSTTGNVPITTPSGYKIINIMISSFIGGIIWSVTAYTDSIIYWSKNNSSSVGATVHVTFAKID